MRVVISGYYGFDNVGDEAILYSIIQVLRESDPNIEIVVLSNNPAYTEGMYQVKAINRWSFVGIYKALKHADGLISGGGSLLQDETGMRSIPYYTGVMKLAHLLKKPVFIYAQGMGPIHGRMNRHIVGRMLKSTFITVRDQASKKLLQKIGIKNDIEIVPDPVLGLTLSGSKSDWWDRQGFTGPVVTVSVREWPSSMDYKARIAKALDTIAHEGTSIVFVPMHGELDEKASKETAKKMKENSFIVPYYSTLEEKITIIGNSNLLVGMRLHSLIFASITYTPFIAISYDPKIEAYAEIAEQPMIGHVVFGDWDGEKLAYMMEKSLRYEAIHSDNLRKKIEPLQRQAAITANKALQYFKK